MLKAELMYQFNNKGLISIWRDVHGKWYVTKNDVFTQKRLTAKEIVGYLCNIAHKEPIND